MADPFRSSRYSIEHAKRRIDEFKRDIIEFHESKPYMQVAELNAEGTYKSHKIKLKRDIPPHLAGDVSDAANALRSSLDQAGFAVAIAAGKSGNNAHFPFGPTKVDASSHISGRSKDIPQEIFDTMMAFKPYRGGNDFLWALNTLCNTNKHEIIVLPAVTPGIATVEGMFYPGFTDAAMFFGWDAAKNEMEITRVPPDATTKVEFTGQLFISLGKLEGVGTEEVVGFLRKTCSVVENILLTVEDRARHFGFIT
jgi:hypothetical protein